MCELLRNNGNGLSTYAHASMANALNPSPQSTIARTTLPFSVTSRLLRTFESRAVQPQKFSANLFRSALTLLTAVRAPISRYVGILIMYKIVAARNLSNSH